MTLAAKLEDIEVTLEHLLMDVFVSKQQFAIRSKMLIIWKEAYKCNGTLKCFIDFIPQDFLTNQMSSRTRAL